MASTKNANGKRPAEAQDEVAPKTLKLGLGPTVEITTTDHHRKDTFMVHADILRDRSGYWRKFVPKLGRSVLFVEVPDEGETLRHYLEWVYQPTIDVAVLAKESDAGVDDRCPGTHLNLAYVWLFADQVQDSECKNAVIDSLILHQYSKVAIRDRSFWEAVYQGDRDTGLRSWLIRSVISSMTCYNSDLLTAKMPLQACRDILHVLLVQKGGIGEAYRAKTADATIYYE